MEDVPYVSRIAQITASSGLLEQAIFFQSKQIDIKSDSSETSTVGLEAVRFFEASFINLLKTIISS
jgi:hypothetical protein